MKGKGVIYSEGKTRSPLPGISMGNQKLEIRWQAPDSGWVKLNTDGSFISTNDAGSSIVLRDSIGKIIVSACRQLFSWHDALEAELLAIREGLSLALVWSQLPIVVESDYLEAVYLIQRAGDDRSRYVYS